METAVQLMPDFTVKVPLVMDICSLSYSIPDSSSAELYIDMHQRSTKGALTLILGFIIEFSLRGPRTIPL